MYSHFLNFSVVRVVPEIRDLPHIHTDPVIMVIYYGLLFNGCPEGVAPSTETMRNLYLCALRFVPVWQQQAFGSEADIVAALLMV